MASGNSPLWIGLLPPLIAAIVVRPLAAKSVDADYWWHLAAGRWMLDHLRVPVSDPFSFTHAGQSWYAHEWLAEVVLALADKAGGYAGGIVLTALIAAAGLWLSWRSALLYGASSASATLLTVAAGLFMVQFAAVRPQVWGFTLFALLLHELAAHDTGGRRRLWLLPFVFVLWVNLNLLALTGLGALGLYALHRGVQALRSRSPDERAAALHVAAVLLASAAGLCANPHGPALLWWSRLYLDQSQTFYRVVQEWQPLPFGGLNLALYAIGALAVAGTLAAMARRRTLWPGVLLLVCAVMGARSARSVPLFALAAVPALAWAVVPRRDAERPAPVVTLPRPFVAAVAVLTLAAAGFAAFGQGTAQFQRRPDLAAGNDPFPAQAAAWLRANVQAPRILDEYGWGGYLIASFAPQRVVYIDGREEMYGEAFFDRYLSILAAKPGWQDALAAAGVNAVLVQPDRPLAKALASDPAWQRIPAGTTAALFVPTDGARR